MTTTRIALVLAIALLSLLAVGCGESGDGDDGSGRDSTSRDATRDDDGSDDDGSDGDGELEEAPELEVDESEGRVGSDSGSFALTPDIASCMEGAGFAQDAPPTGGLAAWRHPDGSRIVVASSADSSITTGIAAEIGTQFEAEVAEEVVVAATEQQSEAAQVCLEP